MNLVPGTRLGRYEIRTPLGAGGMGEVYLAWDHDLEREVAVKVLRGDQTGEGIDRDRRFIQEARAASGLHHPNVAHVYEIGSQDDLRFIAMELVKGETLRDRMAGAPMPVGDVLEIGTQIAAALAAAHKAGIVHRDVKPENVMITPDGYAKVLDFGLAKLREARGEDAATMVRTASGTAMGTVGYMAPEQLLGSEVSSGADVFSLGVVLYEMVAGRRPFEGATASEVARAILTSTPRPLHEVVPGVPPKLVQVIDRALGKTAAERYGDAGDLNEQLRMITREGDVAQLAAPRSVAARNAVIALMVIAILVAGGWLLIRANHRRAAKRSLDTAERLLQQRRLAEAYEAAMLAVNVMPEDPRVRDVLSRTSDRLTIESDPPGATVSLQRFEGPPGQVRMGVTPLTIPQIARADYLLTLEKPGYATGVRPISTLPLYLRGEARLVETPTVQMKLARSGAVPPGMVFVEGGAYRLAGFSRPSDRVIELRDFTIDRYEVTNADFEAFIRAGGYRRRELWKHPFVHDGKAVSFEQAMARFHDTTGLPGPRGWSGGIAPPDLQDHPVTGVTWYEAAAYAEWKGKKLPTIYQWEKAGRYPRTSAVASSYPWGLVGEGVDATVRSNFLGKGTMPVSTMPFGASQWGAHHMAGNVSEWCRNPNPPGYAARGGGWTDAVYAFGQTAAFPAFYSSPTLGFRCAAGGGGDEGDFALSPEGFVPVYKPVDDKTFEGYRRRYDYVRGPLNGRVTERVEAPDWTRETIRYDVTGKTVTAYLYLPKGFRRPLQVIQFAPAGDVVSGWRTLAHSIEVQWAPLIRGGRAVFSVELEGFLGRPRPPDWVAPDPMQEEWVDYTVGRVTEMRRGLDYLETRPDVDRARIAFFGMSAGGGPGVFVTALESRYRSVVFAGTGIATREERFIAPANRIHFVPRIQAPKMMLHGRYDEDSSLKSEAEPMFRLLPEPKRLELYEGGHIAPQEIAVPTITKWLDETMGPVEH